MYKRLYVLVHKAYKRWLVYISGIDLPGRTRAVIKVQWLLHCETPTAEVGKITLPKENLRLKSVEGRKIYTEDLKIQTYQPTGLYSL